MYALGALSAELIFAQAILKEIGLSFLIHARADSSTARAVATKQGTSRKMKHIRTRFLFIQDLVFRKLLTMSSVKTDVNPIDIGTKALGRERFHRLRSPRESDTASRREEACLLNLCNVVVQQVTSQPDAVDTTLTCFSHLDVLGPSRIAEETILIILCAQRTCTRFASFPTLALLDLCL